MRAAPQWVRSTGAAMAIALSAVPMVAAVPGVLAAHDSLDRELHRQHPMVATAADQTASAAMALAEQSILNNQ